jgi:environmental stress-induced protein Ves
MANAKSSILRFGDLTPRPWPNGRGITRDVASQASPDGFRRWLISIAELVEDAEFSHYEGCDRILTVVGQNPIDLHIGGLAPFRCQPLRPAHFPGDKPTRCTLAGGRSRAFNLIVDRARVRGVVSTVSMAGHHEVAAPQGTIAIHCVEGTVTARGEALRPGDTLVEPRDGVLRTGDMSATLLVVGLQ